MQMGFNNPQAQASQPQNPFAKPKKQGSSKGKIAIIIAIVFVISLVIAAAAYYFLSRSSSSGIYDDYFNGVVPTATDGK